MKSPEVCPVCYEEVPPRAKACPSCGADERSGWNEDNLIYDGLDLPSEAWEEDPDPRRIPSTRSQGFPIAWRLAAAILLLALLLLFLRR
jgi:hypothetical protein